MTLDEQLDMDRKLYGVSCVRIDSDGTHERIDPRRLTWNREHKRYEIDFASDDTIKLNVRFR
jgi:hypothetical protein